MPAPSPFGTSLTRLRAGRAAVAGALALSLVGTLGPAADAKDPQDRRNDISAEMTKLRATLDDLSEKSADLVVALTLTQREVARVSADLAEAKRAVAAATARTAELAVELTEAQADVDRTAAALTALAEQTDSAEVRRDDLARSAYQGGGFERFSALLGADTARDLTERLYIVERVSDRQQVLIADLNEAHRLMAAKQVEFQAAVARVTDLKAQSEANLAEAREARESAASAQARLVTLRATQQKQVAAVNAKRASEAKRLAILKKESDQITAMLKRRAAAERRRKQLLAKRKGKKYIPTNDTPRGGGFLAYPVNAPITSEFGRRFHPILHYWRLHAGMDFGAACGTPVYAAGSGSVISAGWGGGYGNRIIIAHSGSLATTYNHLTRIVRHGGSVSKGQLIAYSGTTGLSTGCHLHFEVRLNGVPVNPRKYL